MNKTLIAAAWLAAFVFGCSGPGDRKPGGHPQNPDLRGQEAETASGSHEEGPSHEENGLEVILTPEGMSMAGITLYKAGLGRIPLSLELTGEVVFDDDRVVHLSPRFPGIVREVRFGIGDFVRAGDVVAVIESNESMTPYSLKAPISGRIIERHAAPGEAVSGEETIYLLADLSSVWVHLVLYPGDAQKVKAGMKAVITAMDSGTETEGVIRYIAPVMDAGTRRITARVVLQNKEGLWRPGTFVNARIKTGESAEGILIRKDALQILNDREVIFLQHEPGRFMPVEVKTGESDSLHVLLLAGLEEGVEYVAGGAFELKAQIVTRSLGEHAGHMH